LVSEYKGRDIKKSDEENRRSVGVGGSFGGSFPLFRPFGGSFFKKGGSFSTYLLLDNISCIFMALAL
jgi:hypothetical protein